MPEERPPAPRRSGAGDDGLSVVNEGRAADIEGTRLSRGGEVDEPCPPASQPVRAE